MALDDPSAADGSTQKKRPGGPGTSRVAATLAIWGIAAGLAGLVWLQAQHPFWGLPLTHPVNLILFGICLAIAAVFTGIIWLSPVGKQCEAKGSAEQGLSEAPTDRPRE
jgi:hypothetical protein